MNELKKQKKNHTVLVVALSVLLAFVLITVSIFYWYIHIFSMKGVHTQEEYKGVWQAKGVYKACDAPLIELYDGNTDVYLAIDENLWMFTVIQTKSGEVLAKTGQQGLFRDGQVVFYAPESDQYGDLLTVVEIKEDNIVLTAYIDAKTVSDSVSFEKTDVPLDEIASKQQSVFVGDDSIETERFDEPSDSE